MERPYRGGITVNYRLCIGCKKCYEICPMDVFDFDVGKKRLHVAYPEECWYCGACIYDCPIEGALQMEIPMACL